MKYTHDAKEGSNNSIGNIIAAPVIISKNGKKIILRMIVQRRCITSFLAPLSALKGVMSGRVTIYNANNDELNMYNDNNVNSPAIIYVTNLSTAAEATPPPIMFVINQFAAINGISCKATTVNTRMNGIN